MEDISIVVFGVRFYGDGGVGFGGWCYWSGGDSDELWMIFL